MKSRKPLLSALAAGSLLTAGALFAQNQPMPPTPPAPPSQPSDPGTPMPPAPQASPQTGLPPTQPAPPAPADTPPAPPSTSAMPAEPGMPSTSAMPAQPGMQPMPPAPASSTGNMDNGGMNNPAPAGNPADMNSGAGQQANAPTINSTMGPAQQAGPAPDFAQLANGGKYVTAEQAATGYPLLANDFQHADRNHDGRVSKSEYERWQSPD